jgi:hypothetical protein
MKYLNLNVQMRIHGNLMILLVRKHMYCSNSLFIFNFFPIGTYQCKKANYEIILCPNGGSSGQGEGNSNINWNGNKWAMSCDFPGNDLSSTQVPADRCGPQCEQTSGCTHFVWTTYLGGTCWMKKGPISKNNAVSVNDASAVCGVL